MNCSNYKHLIKTQNKPAPVVYEARDRMSDVQQQLSALLGRDVKQLRKTDEQPPRISIIDVAALITGKGKNQAAEDFRRRAARYPDVKANCIDVEFKDSRGKRGQKDTPVNPIWINLGRAAVEARAAAIVSTIRRNFKAYMVQWPCSEK